MVGKSQYAIDFSLPPPPPPPPPPGCSNGVSGLERGGRGTNGRMWGRLRWHVPLCPPIHSPVRCLHLRWSCAWILLQADKATAGRSLPLSRTAVSNPVFRRWNLNCELLVLCMQHLRPSVAMGLWFWAVWTKPIWFKSTSLHCLHSPGRMKKLCCLSEVTETFPVEFRCDKADRHQSKTRTAASCKKNKAVQLKHQSF